MAAGWTSRYLKRFFCFSEVSDINFLPMEFLRSKVRGGNHQKSVLLKNHPLRKKRKTIDVHNTSLQYTTSPEEVTETSLHSKSFPRPIDTNPETFSPSQFPIDTNPKVSICGKWLQYGPLCVVPLGSKKNPTGFKCGADPGGSVCR